MKTLANYFEQLFVENYNAAIDELNSTIFEMSPAGKDENSKKVISSTAVGMQKNKEFFDELANVIGIDGKFPLASEARQMLANGKIKDGKVRVFINDDNSTNRLYISRVYKDEITKTLEDAGYEVEPSGNDVKITSSTGDSTVVHCGGIVLKAKSGADAGAKAAISKYLIPRTAAQESMIAAILQVLAEGGVRLTDEEIPEHVASFLGEKVISKLTDFGKWLLVSDPVAKTGICEYVNFQVPEDDVENFQIELADFLFNGSDSWYKSFDKLYTSNILSEISDVFTNSISRGEWRRALFLHFWRFYEGKDLRQSLVNDYLNNARCGSQKDTIDKADIFLAFNMNAANKIIKDLMSTKTKEEYFQKMTSYINAKKFIGISLKKISGDVTLAAVNFKTETNAVGDNINPEKKVFLRFISQGNPNNTLSVSEAVIKESDTSEKVTYVIEIPFNEGHAKDLHVSDNTRLQIYVRSNKSTFGAITVEAKFTNASANLGKIVSAIKEYWKYDTTAELSKKLKDAGPNLSKQEVSSKYKEVAQEILEKFKNDELSLYKVLANGIGYPIEIGKGKKRSYVIDSAPYIKIY